MNSYETVFILTPVLSDEQAKEAVQKFEGEITSKGGKIKHSESWGLRKMAYPIQKKSTGFYYLVEFQAEGNVIADYGLVYNNTNLIDLRGNVVLTTHNNDTLFAKQLYFDQNREWLFTNLPVRFRTNNEIINNE